MEIKTRETDNIQVFDITGEIRRSSEGVVSLHQLVKNQISEDKRNFLFNFEGVNYIDSMGMGELIACFKSIHDRGGHLRIMKLQPKIRFLFEITMLTKIFPPFDDEDEAIDSFP